MQPSIGRIVHYKHTSGQVCPAIIISVGEDNRCALQIFRETESYVNPSTPMFNEPEYDPTKEATVQTPGTWTWPPRV